MVLKTCEFRLSVWGIVVIMALFGVGLFSMPASGDEDRFKKLSIIIDINQANEYGNEIQGNTA